MNCSSTSDKYRNFQHINIFCSSIQDGNIKNMKLLYCKSVTFLDFIFVGLFQVCTVKLGNKERFDKELIGIKEPFPVTNLPFTS